MIIYTKTPNDGGNGVKPFPRVEAVAPVKTRDNSVDKRFLSKDENTLAETFSRETGTSLLQEVSLGRYQIRRVSATPKSVFTFSEAPDKPESEDSPK